MNDSPFIFLGVINRETRIKERLNNEKLGREKKFTVTSLYSAFRQPIETFWTGSYLYLLNLKIRVYYSVIQLKNEVAIIIFIK
jgi:hypothetical protein